MVVIRLGHGHLKEKPPILDYTGDHKRRRIWGLSRPVWVLVAAFFLIAGFATYLAIGGRIDGWGDVVFYAAAAVFATVAVLNASRADGSPDNPPLERTGRER